jgi:hypothetical protein
MDSEPISYEPPAIERSIEPGAIARESHYAGVDSSGPSGGA